MTAWLAEDIMNPDVLTVKSSMLVRDLACFLSENEISGAPVTDDTGRLIGVVSATDIVSADTAKKQDEAERVASYYARAFDSGDEAHRARHARIEPEDLEVEDIMTPIVISVDREVPVSRIARMMLTDHIHRVIVRDGDAIAGIVTSFDMLRLFVDDECAEVLTR